MLTYQVDYLVHEELNEAHAIEHKLGIRLDCSHDVPPFHPFKREN